MSNTKKLFSQIIKFGFVGGTAFVIDAGLLFLLTEFCDSLFDFGNDFFYGISDIQLHFKCKMGI